MSYSVDVNLLLYASNRDSAEHERAKSFLDQCLAGGELFCLAWPTLLGYLRMATHSAIFPAPLTPRQATANLAHLLGRPHVRPIGEADGFWATYLQVGAGARGNAVPDAHLAAILHDHDVTTLFTNDDDFRRFTFLRVRNPLS